ncbi:unnamed protein product [Ceutorhynchus assimilis]|uniref:Sialin n=1 Tax=Ceutorhynchus assimilis TaxID=467358 RepID=A0A9N9MKY9_9CUCU|nr:unnamed protein product [Ceutorhynchus assimilis]
MKMALKTMGNDTNYTPSWRFWKQKRYILAFLVFLGYFNIYALRVNMNITIVAMTQNRFTKLENGTVLNIGPEFNWDNKIQGYILSSFFYGYCMTQLLGGILGRKFGGKLIFGAGIASTSAFSLITPWLTDINVYVLIISRVLAGIFEGTTYGALYTIWAKWIPPTEKTRIASQAQSGSYTGAVFSMIFFAYLTETAGWRAVFWFSGVSGLLWFSAWLYFVSESPETNSHISEEELKYIQMSLQTIKATEEHEVPWKSIFSSRAVWALIAILCCDTWGFYTLLTLLPKYFKDVFKFDITTSGVLSALPYMFIAIMTQVSGQFSDLMIRKKWWSVTQTRKIFSGVGVLVQAAFMMGAAYWRNTAGNEFCLVMAVGFGALSITTVCANCLDIAPKLSGVVFGMVNTFGTLPGIVSPIIAGYLVSFENPTLEQWRVMFYITAGLYVLGFVIYTLFGSGDREFWDHQPEDQKIKDRNPETK